MQGHSVAWIPSLLHIAPGHCRRARVLTMQPRVTGGAGPCSARCQCGAGGPRACLPRPACTGGPCAAGPGWCARRTAASRPRCRAAGTGDTALGMQVRSLPKGRLVACDLCDTLAAWSNKRKALQSTTCSKRGAMDCRSQQQAKDLEAAKHRCRSCSTDMELKGRRCLGQRSAPEDLRRAEHHALPQVGLVAGARANVPQVDRHGGVARGFCARQHTRRLRARELSAARRPHGLAARPRAGS